MYIGIIQKSKLITCLRSGKEVNQDKFYYTMYVKDENVFSRTTITAAN
jgi:hypothetical protein